jgi:SAM-dependent methyltransferase
MGDEALVCAAALSDSRRADGCAQHRAAPATPYSLEMAPFGVPEIVASVAGARSVLDVGCGSARLTLALADAGATQVVGVDTSLDRLTQGRARISTHAVGGRVQLFEADFDRALPFADGRFGAAVSRLALMIASDPVATLRELRRVTAPGERIVTALWAPVGENAWFALPRAAAAAVLGNDRADYARSFGRLGSLDEATEVHRAAGLTDVRAETLRNKLDVQHAAGLWRWMVSQNGHVRRLDASLTASERAAVLDELHRRAAEHRADDGSLALARAMTLVIATA